MIAPSWWTNTTGRDAFQALKSGATVTAVVNGTTYTITLLADMTQNYSVYYSPATFSPSLSFPDPWTNYIPTSVSGAGGSGGTFTAPTDWSNDASPPGLTIGYVGGGQYNITIFNSSWSNTTARDAILAKSSGQVFTCIIGGSTVTVTLTSGWTSFGPGSYASVSLSGMAGGMVTSISF
jgi:hypothetical protein